jgi:hypothetical protein
MLERRNGTLPMLYNHYIVEAKSKRDVEAKGWLIELAETAGRGILFYGGR